MTSPELSPRIAVAEAEISPLRRRIAGSRLLRWFNESLANHACEGVHRPTPQERLRAFLPASQAAGLFRSLSRHARENAARRRRLVYARSRRQRTTWFGFGKSEE